MRRIFAALLLLASGSAFAQITITSITPNSGPVTGGTEVTIRGTGFKDECIPPASPCGHLRLGGLAASHRVIDATTIIAIAPPHMPGPVDVERIQLTGGFSLKGAFTYTGNAEDAFDAVLLPIHAPPTPGLFGTTFVPSFTIWGVNPPDVIVFGLRTQGGLVCSPPCPPPPNEEWNPRVFPPMYYSPVDYYVPIGNPGSLLWVSRGGVDRLAFNLRITESTRQKETAGTTIPVVPQRDFRTDAFALIGIPLSPAVRLRLRVYSLDPYTTVRVKIVDRYGIRVERDFLLPLNNPADIYHPAYAEYFQFEGNDIYRIEITPLGGRIDGNRVWAFASVTHNETQHVTLFTPR